MGICCGREESGGGGGCDRRRGGEASRVWRSWRRRWLEGDWDARRAGGVGGGRDWAAERAVLWASCRDRGGAGSGGRAGWVQACERRSAVRADGGCCGGGIPLVLVTRSMLTFSFFLDGVADALFLTSTSGGRRDSGIGPGRGLSRMLLSSRIRLILRFGRFEREVEVVAMLNGRRGREEFISASAAASHRIFEARGDVCVVVVVQGRNLKWNKARSGRARGYVICELIHFYRNIVSLKQAKQTTFFSPKPWRFQSGNF